MGITFCIPTKNNLRYLKGCIGSIQKNSSLDNEVVVYVDADTDGTEQWLIEKSIKYLKNETNTPKGIANGYNRCIEVATKDVVCMFHADMYMGKGFDVAIMKHLKPKTVVSGTRVEPPIHPEGKEKIVLNFGMYPEDFDADKFDKFVADQQTLNEKAIEQNANNGENFDATTRGIFAPWAIYKRDILDIGMHDVRFHSYHEDSDIFNRFILSNYSIIQTWDGLVYHFTCRGGQFQDGVEEVTKDPEFHKMKRNSFRNYVRKWKSVIQNDEYQYPIFPNVYNVTFNVKNCNYEMLYLLEPWCYRIVTDMRGVDLERYIESENENSIENIAKKVKYSTNWKPHIELFFDCSKMTPDSFNTIYMLGHIIDNNTLEPANYEFDIFRLEVKRIEPITNELIINEYE